MNKIGIRAHDVGKLSPNELAKTIEDYQFEGIQLVFNKALNFQNPLEHVEIISTSFKALDVIMLGAYFNLVHPDKTIVDAGILNFKKHLMISKTMNAKYVGTETGSLMGSPWGYIKENHSNSTFNVVVDIVKELVLFAEENDACVAIEGAYAHVVHSPTKVRELLDIINSNSLKITLDLFNFLHIGNYMDRMGILEESLALFGKDIVIIHLKDFIVENNILKQVGLGKGLMDYPRIIKRITETTPNAYLIFEGVTGNDISDSLTYIKTLLLDSSS